MATLIDQIRQEADRQGLGASELARRSGLHRVHVSAVLSGRRADPRVSTIEALCRALDIPLGHKRKSRKGRG